MTSADARAPEVLGRLTDVDRQRLVRAVFACGTWPELRALAREIALEWAATPEQRAANAEQLAWVRTAAIARREMVGRPARS